LSATRQDADLCQLIWDILSLVRDRKQQFKLPDLLLIAQKRRELVAG
jgi:hypothetical protein